MAGKRSRPSIGKLIGAVRSGILDPTIRPKSPRGLKNYDQGGVGLGIVVALDKSSCCGGGGEIIAKYAISGQVSSLSNPIPVKFSAKNKRESNKISSSKLREEVMMEMEMTEALEEEFTYVTCHGPNKSITTRVYYDGGEYGNTVGHNRHIGVFNISPAARLFDDGCNSGSDFLSSCHLCKKALHGKDIYMYRGEKAFCSPECRQRQIGIDERKEQCRSEASRSNGEVSSSPYTYTSRAQMFSTGIFAV